MTKVLGLSGVRFLLAGVLGLALAACFVGRAEAASGASVVAGDRALTLNWSALKGAAAYRVSWHGRVLKGGKPTAAWSKKWLGLKVLNSSVLSYKFTGLANGAQYQIRLESKAKAKKSRWVVRSTPVASPKAVTPGAPTSVLATSVGQGRATVSWKAPVSNGGSAITGYTVRASGDSSQACATNGALSCTVAGLANGTAYTFTVVATSAVGNSGASAASGAVTPATCATGGVCVVGDSGPGGGTVFYAPGTAFTDVGTACFSSCRYLEVAPAPGWSSGGSTDPTYQWGGGNGTVVGSCSNKIITGATGTAIGSGYANTAAIITACDQSSGNDSAPAARAAWTYVPTVGGVSIPGWFLPSKDEAFALDASDVGGLTYHHEYWTSSQSSALSFEANNAFYQYIGYSGQQGDHKQQSFHVRPIRAF